MKDSCRQDREVEILLGTLLRTGVSIAAATVVAGALWYLLHHGSEIADYRRFRQLPGNSPGFRAVLDGIVSGHSRSLIQAGLLLLIATPVARVAFSLVAFFKERDYAYVAITAVVFGALLISLLGG